VNNRHSSRFLRIGSLKENHESLRRGFLNNRLGGIEKRSGISPEPSSTSLATQVKSKIEIRLLASDVAAVAR